MPNFLKKIREKIASPSCQKLQKRGDWHFRWHKNRSGLADYQVILICSISIILLAFVYKANMAQLSSDILRSLLPSQAGTTASLSDTNQPAETTTPAETATPPAETTAPTDMTNLTAPEDMTIPPAATSTSPEAIGSLMETTSSTDNNPSLTETATPANNNPSPETTTISVTPPPPPPAMQENIPVVQNPPVIIKVISPILSGNFKTGVVPIMILFDKPIFVSGNPQLIISTGSPAAATADYKPGFKRLMLFLYHIEPGNYSSDLDYSSPSALVLNGGEIKDEFGNPANLTLPQPGSPGSLSDYSNIVINAGGGK